MQKNIITVYLLLLSLTTYSQTEQGNIYVGASGSYAHFISKSVSFPTIGIDANAGFFIIEELEGGIAFAIDFKTQRGDTYNKFLNIALYGRYYISPFLFTNFFTGLGLQKMKALSDNNTSPSVSFLLPEVHAGLTHSLSV